MNRNLIALLLSVSVTLADSRYHTAFCQGIGIDLGSAVATISGSKVKKSISEWVSCNGRSDDTEGVQRAFVAARHAAFTLVVDCPVFIHSALDIERVIYIDDDTDVEFSASGKFTVDNVMHPAFVLANSKRVTLTDWNVEYDASLPANPDVRGYDDNGQFVPEAGHTQPASPWNDLAMTRWLAANRRIVFDRREGNVRSYWAGATNTCAIFFMSGDTSQVSVTGLYVHVPQNAGVDRFAPVVFQFSPNFKSNQSVTAKTPKTAQFFAVPHALTFSNITFDGTYMGWVGGMQDAVFEHIRSHRYGDLQDARGGNVGGVGKWFAPPHLFYFVYDPREDSALFNTRIHVMDVVDDGPRIGTARDKGGHDSVSGYALSIKIGCSDCSVDNYRTTRPDGFLDVLPSNGLTISNVAATYDSAFLNNLFPGWRFPMSGYSNLTFENISFEDSAASSVQPPIGNAMQSSNEHITFKNVRVGLNRWSGRATSPLPVIAGVGNHVALDYIVSSAESRIVGFQAGAAVLVLQGTSAALRAGSSTQLTWKSKDANSCSAAGAWWGAVATQGTHSVRLLNAGNYDFILDCRDPGTTSSATLRIVVE